MAKMPAFAGSSDRYKGPSSTEKPSAQKCRRRSTLTADLDVLVLGSSIT